MNQGEPKKSRPAVLLILDGWGYRKERLHNAIALAKTPVWDDLWANRPWSLLDCAGPAVGLPEGQMGSSEVGHMNLGAGRVVYQDYSLISQALKDGSLATNPALGAAMDCAGATHTLHLFGLFSPGGVHSHEDHIFALIEAAAARGVKKVLLHAFLDGRDTPPQSAEASLLKFEALAERLAGEIEIAIASLCGRYYAMDRDQRFERTQAAYDLLTSGACERRADTALEGLAAAYAASETDEFVRPTAIHPEGAAPRLVADGDAIVFMNFRSDRARQLSRAFREPNFSGFPRKTSVRLGCFVTLTHYLDGLDAEVAFASQPLVNTLGEYLAQLGKTQLRVAETEKYAHVTFFFSGGREQEYPGETRTLIPSPQVATYDLQPEMSAEQVAEVVVASLDHEQHDVIICNLANADMVGHTGNLDAAICAVETVDLCIGRIVKAVARAGGVCLVTADHGNVEQMHDINHEQPHTAHTQSPVPLVYATGAIGAIGAQKIGLNRGRLADVVPTLLCLMGERIPKEMSGSSLLNEQSADRHHA